MSTPLHNIILLFFILQVLCILSSHDIYKNVIQLVQLYMVQLYIVQLYIVQLVGTVGHGVLYCFVQVLIPYKTSNCT